MWQVWRDNGIKKYARIMEDCTVGQDLDLGLRA